MFNHIKFVVLFSSTFSYIHIILWIHCTQCICMLAKFIKRWYNDRDDNCTRACRYPHSPDLREEGLKIFFTQKKDTSKWVCTRMSIRTRMGRVISTPLSTCTCTYYIQDINISFCMLPSCSLISKIFFRPI